MKPHEPDELDPNSAGTTAPRTVLGTAPIEDSAGPETGASMLEHALAHHEAGRLDQARAIYCRILDADPLDAEVLHLFGVAAHQSGEHATAIEYITRAIGINPAVPLYHNNLGSAYRGLKLLDDARRCITRSLELKPDSAQAHYNLGVVLSDGGNRDAAESCFRAAISLQPDFAQAHFNLGILLRRAGRRDDAITCFRQVLRIEPGHVVAEFLCAAICGHNALRAPDQYVAGVFDADADKFDAHLVESLHYDTPQRLLKMCGELLGGPGEKKDFLDLGCGTGLAGVSFAPHAGSLVGVDLSANMLARARARQLYQRLEHAELLAMMQREKSAGYDVVVAADVFIYSGRLDDIFAEVKRLLRVGGLFTFSVESLDALYEAEAGPAASASNRESAYRLNANGRFAHSSRYIHALAATCGFRENAILSAPTRLENGTPVAAWLVLLESEAVS